MNIRFMGCEDVAGCERFVVASPDLNDLRRWRGEDLIHSHSGKKRLVLLGGQTVQAALISRHHLLYLMQKRYGIIEVRAVVHEACRPTAHVDPIDGIPATRSHYVSISIFFLTVLGDVCFVLSWLGEGLPMYHKTLFHGPHMHWNTQCSIGFYS
jgi:hypothetical protein